MAIAGLHGMENHHEPTAPAAPLRAGHDAQTRLPSRIIVVGASAGGVPALLQLANALPDGLDAALVVVLHIGAHPSVLPELLRSRCRCPASHVRHLERPRAGAIHVAPPDHHVLLETDHFRLTRGPKENHARPAIDPLFRSAALHWGPRAIGVVLTGQLADGAAGLQAIRDCGGITVVQDPASAAEPAMPRAALRAVQPDLCVGLDAMPREIARLAGLPLHATGASAVREQLQHEVHINEGIDIMDHLQAIGRPSGLSCPDCGGSLFEVNHSQPPRYRCHTGHAFSAQALCDAHDGSTEDMLHSGVRVLQERAMLLRRLAAVSRASGMLREAQIGERRADEAREQAGTLMQMIERRKGAGA